MRIRFLSPLLLLILILSCRSQHLGPIQEQIVNASWEAQEIVDGAIWKYHHFDSLFDSRQSITVFDIDLSREDIKVEIPHIDSGFSKTSILAEREGAFAAVNGSYFNTKTGGTVVPFYKEGQPLNQAQGSHRDNAGFSLNAEGTISIIKKPEGGWQNLENPYTILTAGPLLLYNGERLEQVDEKFNTNRHPRTAVGITKNNHLIAVVVDGRSSQAHGMSLYELATLMKSLGCAHAMNLDGGGSSTAWVRDQPFNGVVSYPSDNKIFDHEGEREVANAVVFISESKD